MKWEKLPHKPLRHDLLALNFNNHLVGKQNPYQHSVNVFVLVETLSKYQQPFQE